jgi:lipoprotein-releasing system permease protein
MKKYWFFVRKYIVAKRSIHFITLITYLSIIGIIVGIAAMICVTSIFNGFRTTVQTMLVSYDPHIQIIPTKGVTFRTNQEITTAIATIEEIQSITETISGKIVATNGSNIQPIEIIGIDEKKFSTISGIPKAISMGVFTTKKTDGMHSLVIGMGLSDKLRVMVGVKYYKDTVNLLSASELQYAAATYSKPTPVKANVKGIFQTNTKEYDNGKAYTSLESAREVLQLQEGEISSIDIRLKDYSNAMVVASQLQSKLPKGFVVETWYSLHKDLYSVMQFERLVSFIILSVILLVAVFNIFVSQSLLVQEKKRDIMILQSMGASKSFIKKLFLVQGMLIGSIATVLGVGLGLGLCYGQLYFGWITLEQGKFIIDALPISISWIDVISVTILTILLSFLVSLYPSNKASSLPLQEALRRD